MANTAAPFGFRLIQPLLGANWYVKGTNAAIYQGDLVKTATAGKAVVATAGDIELLGVAMGYAAATATSVLIADNPDQQYYIQDDGVGGTLAVTSINLNADVVATAGNATFLASRHSLDTSNAQTTAANLRILGFHPDDTVGKYVRCRVVINEHSWAKKTAGI